VYASLTAVRGAGAEVRTIAHMAAGQILPWLREFDGYQGFLLLADVETGSARLLSMWESEDALERSERGRREMRESMIAAAGAEIERVERYELFAGDDLPTATAEPQAGEEGPLLARVTTFAGAPESIEEGFRTFRDDLVHWFSDATGFRGWLALLDVPGGKSIGITLWASEEALADEAGSGAVLRNEVAAGLETTVTSVERYEVVVVETLARDEAG
jgi:heme-degrading monooxygenase HmoA